MDETKAADLLQKAADLEDAWAMGVLGDCYLQGKGVRKDRARAVELYREAARRGDAHASKALKELEGRTAPDKEKKSGGLFQRLFGKK